MRSLVIGTAGHVDHGKSALVKALTGTDPDRLKEEQERGITIDLGFAHARGHGVNIAFVDVPGHERFVRNMLAGAGGIDAVLLVVAADESVMPQTREHFDICRLLGIERGLIAITKADLVDADTLDVVALEARELVAGSFLDGAPVIPVSARTGAGLQELTAALAALAGAPPRLARDRIVRLPVDRVFTMKGFGTVVTGTLVSGRIGENDELDVLPDGGRIRVRGVQIHGEAAHEAMAPTRVALNVSGADASLLGRGMTLASEDAAAVTRLVDVHLQLLPSSPPLRHGSRVRVHHGTSEVLGRVSIAARRERSDGVWLAARAGELGVTIPSGGDAFTRLRLEEPAVLTRGDRMVLRAYSPPTTVGGAVALDPEPSPGGVRRPTAVDRFERLGDIRQAILVWLQEAGARGLERRALVRRAGLGVDDARRMLDELVAAGRAIALDERVFDPATAAAMEREINRTLREFHRAHPLETGMPRESLREQAVGRGAVQLFETAIARLRERGEIAGSDRIARTEHRPTLSADQSRAHQIIESAIRDAGLTPPDLATLAERAQVPVSTAEQAVRLLIREKRIVRLDPLLVHAESLARLKTDLAELRKKAANPNAVTIDVATFKDRYGLTRKYAIPLLEWLDSERVTRRVGEKRVIL